MGMAASIPYYTVEDLDRFPNDGNRYELLDGVLLVTPAPGFAHQLIASRIATILSIAVQVPGHGFVLGPGVVCFPPRTQLEPDVLVVPPWIPPSGKWEDIKEHWLAVEVISRSSRIYDREFKRNEYLRRGVPEVWLVDKEDRSVEVARVPGESTTVRDAVIWRVPRLDLEVRVDLSEVFAGME
jgi:Uma2 family endonuclease